MNRLKGYFLSGFFTVIPIGLSALVIWWFVRLVDNTFAPVVDAGAGFHFPGLGLLAALLAILLAGVAASHVFGERLLDLAESVFLRIPVYKWVYATVKQMTDAFSPENKTSFRSVVMVEYPRLGTYCMGFVTHELVLEKGDGTQPQMVAVYIPTNHFYFGEIVLFKKDEVIPTAMNIQQGIQATLSLGASLPPRLGKP